jgi:hypothetical protein
MDDTRAYEEAIPKKKFINTEQFMDKNGKPMSANEDGLPAERPEIGRTTIEFNR